METSVQKWGNSLALRIPKPVASELGLKSNSPVRLSLKNGKLVIVPVTKKSFSLKKLLARVNTKNKHNEVDYGEAVGGEVW
jgi:antitoxin MazE